MDEFVKRDLNNIESLNNLQWRIKGQKLTKEKVLEYLSSNEGREMLKNEKFINLFDNYAESIAYPKKINSTNRLFDFIKNDNNWYDLIFK